MPVRGSIPRRRGPDEEGEDHPDGDLRLLAPRFPEDLLQDAQGPGLDGIPSHEAAEVLRQGLCGPVALLGVLGEALEDDGLQVLRDAGFRLRGGFGSWKMIWAIVSWCVPPWKGGSRVSIS